jgi:hypothetical protein
MILLSDDLFVSLNKLSGNLCCIILVHSFGDSRICFLGDFSRVLLCLELSVIERLPKL